jgi:hypothetical protein
MTRLEIAGIQVKPGKDHEWFNGRRPITEPENPSSMEGFSGKDLFLISGIRRACWVGTIQRHKGLSQLT